MAHDREYSFRIRKWYADSAKTFTQTAVAALVLPIVFAKQVLGQPESGPARLDALMLGSWCFFLMSIAAGLLFQWLAPKAYELEQEPERKERFMQLKTNPGYAYGVMMFCLFVGALLFTLSAWLRLSASSPPQ